MHKSLDGDWSMFRSDPSIVTSSTQHIKAKFLFLERHSNQKEVTNEVTVAGGSHLHKDILLFLQH